MPVKLLSTAALLACLSYGQTKVFHFAHAQTPQEFQEVANVVRMIPEINRMAVASETRTLALRGSADQLAAAEWLFQAVDKPAGTQAPATLEFKYNDVHEPAVRVFYLSNIQSPQHLQEVVNAIRSVADMQHVVPNDGIRAIVVRGTDEQVKMAEFLIKELDRSPGATPSGSHEYAFNPGPDVAHVFFMRPATTPQSMQEILTQVRVTADIQRATTYSGLRALVLRGTPAQITTAGYVIQENEKPIQ